MHISQRRLMIVLAGLVLLAGCGKSAHDRDEKYYLVASNIRVPYWQTTAAGLQAAAQQIGVTAEMRGPDSYDKDAEREELESVLRHRDNPVPSGILISPADATLLNGDIDTAIAQGIPVITIDSDAADSKRLLFIGTNNYQAGLQGGRTVAKLMNGKGNLEIYTIPKQTNLDERLRGYRDALADYPGIKIAEVFDMQGDAGAAFNRTYELLAPNAKSRTDAWACLEAISGAEVAKVLERKNVHDRIVVAMDTQPETIQYIEKGIIATTIAQKPYTMAAFGLRLLDELHHNKLKSLDRSQWAQTPTSPLPVFVDTGTTLVDKNNAQAFATTSPSESAELWQLFRRPLEAH